MCDAVAGVCRGAVRVRQWRTLRRDTLLEEKRADLPAGFNSKLQVPSFKTQRAKTELKGKEDKSTIIMGDFNTPSQLLIEQAVKKINKNIKDLNGSLNT